jgi:hypothetical protein
MSEPSKIDFRHRRIREIEDITDIVAMIFPGNTNQQNAAARILLTLKAAAETVPSLRVLEEQHGISRRTLERTRAKLAHVGLIENIGPLSKRANGHPGWRLSGRMSGAMRLLAEKIDTWKTDTRPERQEKDERLVGMQLS